jgi:heme A synthase
MALMSIYILWGSITGIAFVWSVREFVNRKKQESIDKSDHKTDSISKVIMLISVLSLILFMLAGILFMYFLLILALEEPLLSKLLNALSLWPVIFIALVIFTIELDIKSIVKPTLKKIRTIMIAITAMSIILYYCFYGAVLYFALR